MYLVRACTKNTFLGITRDSFEGRRVLTLSYEAYARGAACLIPSARVEDFV